VKAKTTFTPLHDRILVQKIEEHGVEVKERTYGSIILPGSAQEVSQAQKGEVIVVGKGKSNDEGKIFPLDVKAGDTILFGKYAGTSALMYGEDFLILREEEVLGIVKK
jgi:chaperonin GroES